MRRKKKILIIMHSMHIGGAERALLGMLSAFDFERYQVDLFLSEHNGELMKYIPREIHLLPEIPRYSYFTKPFSLTVRKREFKMAYVKLRTRLACKAYTKKSNGAVADATIYAQRFALPYLPPINPNVEYDLAISYRTPHYLAIEKVRAKKTLAWIHTDYTKVTIDIATEHYMWSKFDYIASISDECSKGFLSVFPELKEKLVLFEHVIQPSIICDMADEFVPNEIDQNSDVITICSIGRFVPAKNFTSIPKICRVLLESGLKVKWYLIGFGEEESEIIRQIETLRMEKNIIILGKKENPYPYIKACDIYAQPSLYEGRSVAVIEAQILKKPVVISNYPTATSQLRNGINGLILPLDTEQFADKLVKVICDQDTLRQLSQNADCDITTEFDQMRVFDRLIEGDFYDH